MKKLVIYDHTEDSSEIIAICTWDNLQNCLLKIGQDLIEKTHKEKEYEYVCLTNIDLKFQKDWSGNINILTGIHIIGVWFHLVTKVKDQKQENKIEDYNISWTEELE